MRENNKLHLYSIFLSLAIYLCLALVFIFSFNTFTDLMRKNPQKVIVEGLLLPRTNFPLNTTFNVDPLLTSSNVDSIREIRKSISFLIFSKLFRENPDGSITPDIVEKYEFTNSQNLTLNIRKGLMWHDGTPLNANDVQFTFNTLKGIGQSTLYYAAVNGNDLQIDLIDEYSLKLTLANSDGPRPNAAYLHSLTFPILPKHILENYPKPSLNLLSETDFGKKPIGSGILKYGENKIEELVLMRNGNYYDGPVLFDRYVFKFYKDYEKLIEDYKLKNVDLIRRTEAVAKDKIYENLQNAGMKYDERIIRKRRLVLYFNLGNRSNDASVFSKSTLIRRGLLNVIDRSGLIRVLGNAKESFGPIDQDSWAFSPDVIQKQTLSIESFDKLVTGLGYSKVDGIYQKEGIPLKFTVSYLDGGIRTPIIEELTSQLKSAGVNLVAKPITDNNESPSSEQSPVNKESFYSIVNNRDYDALLTAVDHFMDPDVFNEWHSTKIAAPGLNLSGFSSKVVDRTLEDGKINSGDARKADYIRFQRTFFEEVPAIYLLNPGMQIYYSSELKISGSKEITEEIYFYNEINKWEVN